MCGFIKPYRVFYKTAQSFVLFRLAHLVKPIHLQGYQDEVLTKRSNSKIRVKTSQNIYRP